MPLPVQYRLNRYARSVLAVVSTVLVAVTVVCLVEWLPDGRIWASATATSILALWLIGIVRSLRFKVIFHEDSILFRKGLWGEHARRYKDIDRLHLRPDQATLHFVDGLRVGITTLDGDLTLVGDIVGPRARPELKIELEEW